MARKHKRSALEAMLAVRTAPTQKIEAPAYDGRTGLQKFTATETAREKEAQDEVIRNAETALADSLQARRDDIARTIFTEPSAELQERCTLISGRVAGSVEDIRAQIHEAFNSFRLESENSGVRLEPAGIEKMNRVAAQNMKVDYRDPQSFSELFNLLESLNCFTDHDRTITRQPERVEPIAQPQRTLEGLNTDTVEGRKQASALMLQENQYEAASH